MPSTKLSIETKADGSGSLIAAQTLTAGQTLTAFSIGRDADDVFVENLAATWSLTNKTGSVVDGDLVAAGDGKSAVFTAALDGTATIHVAATLVDPETADSGIISVIDAIITLTLLKTYMAETGSSHDSILSQWITIITGVLESLYNQPIVSRQVTDILDGDGSSVIYLRAGRILSLVGSDETARLANIQYRDSVADGWVNLLTAENVIYIESPSGWKIELLDGNVFPSGRKNIRVKYNAGMDGVLLQDVQKLALEMIQTLWNESKKGNDMLGKISKVTTEGGTTYNVGLIDLNPRWNDVITRGKKYGCG